MSLKDIAIVFDCGATNIRVVAINIAGEIIASKSFPNETDEDPFYPGGKIWDFDKLWGKLCKAARIVCNEIDTGRVAGITVTTFGVDGTFTDSNGEIIYPVISWQCQRTQPIMTNIEKYIPTKELFEISGVFPYSFNTIHKIIWFKENRPEIIQNAYRFLFMPSLIIQRLTGHLQNDTTMSGTSMMFDLKKRNFSKTILSKIGVDDCLFGELAEPGDFAGAMHKRSSDSTGLLEGTPVFFAGHDTQFAIFGSGAALNQPVLSSGTWEILMARTNSFNSGAKELHNCLTTEADSQVGKFNIGQNWLGSGVLEWFSRNFYSDLSGDQLYNTMIAEAEEIVASSHGLIIDPAFYKDAVHIKSGIISGLTIQTKRGEIYKAILESLAYRLRWGIDMLQDAGKFKADKIICVGGGSKNRIWNQLRADICQIPIQIIDQKETTVLGAALHIFSGCGLFDSVEKARNSIKFKPQIIYPSNKDSNVYNLFYEEYLSLFKG